MGTKNLAHSLELSVAHGDIDNAKKNAKALVESKSKVIINVVSQPRNFSDFRLQIRIENKHCLDAILYIKVKKSISILELKESVQEKFGFPTNIQRWIFKQRILGNEEVLNDLGEIDLLYLYLICEF